MHYVFAGAPITSWSTDINVSCVSWFDYGNSITHLQSPEILAV